jgi:D-alanyl-D-alanine carboxypeptidase (penicillin-binding protein 5/6)
MVGVVIASSLVLGSLATGAGALASAPAPPPAPPPTTPPLARASVLVDVDTGNVLDANNDRVPLPPASLTKVITALAAIENLPDDAQVPVSPLAASMPADKLFMKPFTLWTFDEMIHALLLSSANDAAVALAEKAGGSIEGFQRMFALTAADLGMADNPVLNDPAGLDGPDGLDGGNLVSARDLAIGARALLAQPVLAGIVATPIFSFDGPDGIHHRLTNHNRYFLTTYPGAIGVKTGYTQRAGTCLIAAARLGGRTMLAVVLHGNNPTQTAEDLLDKGFFTPVGAEPVADRLPSVHLGPATPPATVAPPATSTSSAVALPTHARLLPAGAGSGSPPAKWWPWAVAALVLVAAVLVGRWRVRRRRRRRRIFARS